MTTDQLITWAVAHPWPTAGITAAALTTLIATAWAAARAARRLALPPGSILVAGLGAMVCTAYSADTSWRFAEHRLGMADSTERAVMFAAGELALLACATMARATKAATATDTAAGTTGVPGVLVWCITGVQVIPAFTESGLVGGLVRAFFGPVMAGLLWHLAMGLEIRVARPEALSTGLPAVISRELRERLLSRFGLVTRDRTAEQITRDRWTGRAVDLAAYLAHRPTGWAWYTTRLERRLSRAVGRAQVGAHPQQRRALLQLLSARLHSTALPTLDLPSPWEMREPASPPRSAPVVAYEQLRQMQPLDAVVTAASAHPSLGPDELRQVLLDHGVIVSETQVSIGLRASASAHPRALNSASAAAQNLFAVHATWDGNDAGESPDDGPDADCEDVTDADADRALLPAARLIDADHRARHGRPAGLRALQTGMRIGQARAQRMRALLDQEVTP
ncbi:hypothetical protein [Streptomyces sp. OR43]|uniref:hypothetical protein n=1 Tax=Streptomyces sp. or43 TaxID=2478957 RepID=UPI0021C8B17C|nr:hypothetical protein [Streptomyces sp. or43]